MTTAFDSFTNDELSIHFEYDENPIIRLLAKRLMELDADCALAESELEDAEAARDDLDALIDSLNSKIDSIRQECAVS